MHVSHHDRTLIIGNSGSGKTWLAEHLGARLNLPVIHLDDLRWESGHYGVIARNNQVVADEVRQAGLAETWIMEGVYGWLAELVYQRASPLIWLDLPEAECIANVRQRGIQGGGSEQAFRELLTWIGGYRLRDNSSCFAAHARLFEASSGSKVILKSRRDITAYLTRKAN